MEKGRTATVCQPLPDPRSRSARSSLGRTVSFGSRGCAEHLKGGRAATNWPGPTGTMCYWEDQRLAAVGALCGIALGVALLLRQVNWPGVWHPLGVAARSCLHWLRYRAGLPGTRRLALRWPFNPLCTGAGADARSRRSQPDPADVSRSVRLRPRHAGGRARPAPHGGAVAINCKR